ncbi:concanavalin A-like lectin/glucanase domain-containing protein [Chaetomium sp. MPI-SDFR-AT-0129]|nr:concanavalin A-like lectin/glucanase domain-containing protein [Chaetomium sp. MPI-SDFR-AT-0129]
MHFNSYLSLLPLIGAALPVSASDPPSYDGYTLAWADSFQGPSGSLPNENNWNIIDGNLGVNNELETYRRDPYNVQTSGGTTLQITPRRASDGSWTSGRLESKYTFTPKSGGRTKAEAGIRFGANDPSTKQGIWPAFWLLGDSIRQGTSWPACGELDVMETVNGQLTGYGTVHCDVSPGGVCNEPSGRGKSVALDSQEWHTWSIVWDLTSGDWGSQSISWFLNGQQFNQITGSSIGNQGVWNSLTTKPLYLLLNVAVGGSWPGNPNGNTQDGPGAMMEVAYVAQYHS